MMPKSLLHQTLAKLFSETERSFLFCYCINFLKNINHSTKSIILKNQNSVNYFFTVVILQHITTLITWSGWVDSNHRPLPSKGSRLTRLTIHPDKKNPETLWASGFVYILRTITTYTQTSDVGAHEQLSLNVRYSGHCLVMCTILFISLYIKL